jgi:hypothetical protein
MYRNCRRTVHRLRFLVRQFARRNGTLRFREEAVRAHGNTLKE